MLGKRIINTATGAAPSACTTDTVQILDGTPFDSIATYELESDASNSIKSGYIGNGAIFNGSSSYVDTGISSLSGAFSVSLWINEISLASGNMFGNWNSTSANDIYISTNISGQLRLGIDGISNQYFGSSGDISVNTWHHIVMTFNNGTVEAYLDGDSLGTSTTSNTSFSSGLNFVIGAGSTKSNASHFNGTIDEVRIYNTALTQANVDTLYAETASSTISISGLQAHYKFEGDATDETGNYDGTAYIVTYNEYDGTATNVTYATGKFGNAAVFNGSSGYIDSNYTFPADLSYSISCWFNTSNTSQMAMYSDMDSSADSSSSRISLRLMSSGNFGLIIGNGSTNWINESVSSSSYLDGNWHHIVQVINGTSVKLYADGNTTPIADLTSTVSSGTLGEQSLIFGKLGHYNGQYFDGSIDQIRIYDKALSAANVAELYAETLSTSQTNISLNAPSGVAYYKMNDATDETGSYDGTATNVDFNVAGKFGNAGEFNGSSKIDTGIDLDTYDETWSISLWVKFTFNSSYRYIAGDLSVTTALNGFTIDTSTTGQIRFRFRNSSGSVATITSPNTYGDGNWHHITGVKGSSNNYLYIDGSQVGSVATVNGISHSTNLILGQVGAFNGFYLGSIDQVRIFDRAITANEVTTLYNEVYCQPTIVPTDHFEPVIYTGNGTDITVNTGLKPDMVWIKERTSTSSHRIVDSVRGDKKRIFTNVTNAESEVAAGEVLLDNGFQVGADNGSNQNGEDYVAWNWKAGGAAVSNTDGTITSQVSASTEAGFSIVKYTGNNTAGATIGHGLNSAPELIITKNLNDSEHWVVGNSSAGWTKGLYLSATTAAFTNNKIYGVDPTSTVYTVSGGGFDSTNTLVNTINKNYISYAFHSVDGMSKIGSYTGTGANGNSIVTGFRPAYVMVKVTNDSASWGLFDNKRGGDLMLRADTNSADANGNNSVSFASNGFTLPETGLTTNASGKNYIYLAFAEENTQPEPELANSFNVVTYTGNGSTQAVTGLGFQPDLVWIKNRDHYAHNLTDSIRGVDKQLRSNGTNAEITNNTIIQSFDSDGFTVGSNVDANENNVGQVAWCWKASNDSTINNDGSITSIVSANPASGFSVCSYNSNGTAGATVGTGLDSAAEMIIVKNRDDSDKWAVYHSATGATKFLSLNETSAATTSSAYWNNTEPTENSFTIGATSPVNSPNNEDYIAYCFHSVDGYQKIGSYSGSSSNVTVTTGFRPRWVMVKSTTSAHSWYVIDSARGATSSSSIGLFPNLSNAEASGYGIYFEDNGFVVSSGVGTGTNASGNTYIYLAIA